MSIIVGRTSVHNEENSLEYLLNDKREYREFESKQEAMEFVRENVFPDSTDEELEGYFVFIEAKDLLNPEK
jgi:hypothetical protein